MIRDVDPAFCDQHLHAVSCHLVERWLAVHFAATGRPETIYQV
jgi:hypothetical protein